MESVSEARQNIADYAHPSSRFLDAFIKYGDRYAAFYTSKYLIQDTEEGISTICEEGFSQNPLRAYIEFWGTFQALIIQQDAIREIHKAVNGKDIEEPKDNSAWHEIRRLRNELAGHPAAQGNSSTLKRTFMGRRFGSLDAIKFEQCQPSLSNSPLHPTFNMRALIERYDVEASAILLCVLDYMRKNWPP